LGGIKVRVDDKQIERKRSGGRPASSSRVAPRVKRPAASVASSIARGACFSLSRW